jgi:hypothetical protein
MSHTPNYNVTPLAHVSPSITGGHTLLSWVIDLLTRVALSNIESLVVYLVVK